MIKNNYFLLLIIGLLVVSSCDEDDYYDVPDDLKGNIVQVLETKGNFSHMLKALKRSGYEKPLSASSYTLFAPTDEAFDAFLKEKGYGSVDDIPEAELKSLVQHHILSNAYSWRVILEQGLSGLVSPDDPKEHIITPKKPTLCYKPPVVETFEEKEYTVWKGRKFLPFFNPEFFLEPGDYNFFYPDTEYTTFNVANAAITGLDQGALNGIIHEVDHVLDPLPTIGDVIYNDDQFSLFKELTDRFLEYQYNYQATQEANKDNTGDIDSLFNKKHEGIISFAHDELDGVFQFGIDVPGGVKFNHTAFVPKNDVLQAYLNETFLKFYGSVEDIPDEAIRTLLNAHLVGARRSIGILPSDMEGGFSTNNGDNVKVPKTDVFMARWTNNGPFYGMKKVIQPNAFSSVIGDLFFNPDYSVLLKMMASTDLQILVSDPTHEYTFLAPDNDAFEKAGIRYDEARKVFFIKHPVSGEDVRLNSTQLKDILELHFISKEIEKVDRVIYESSIDGQNYLGLVPTGSHTFNVISGGSQEQGVTISNRISGTRKAENGTVYAVDQVLLPAQKSITQLLLEPGGPYEHFGNVLRKAGMVVGTSIPLLASGNFTVLVPTQEALDAYDLPDNRVDLEEFLRYFFVQGKQVYADRSIDGEFQTMRVDKEKTTANNRFFHKLRIVSDAHGALSVTDGAGNVSTIADSDNSNVISQGIAVHLIDKILLSK
ncbi:hypothetical protein FUAX_43950 (plasmid) [Fulvitalea axinellae]|uniref:FAS1 domain-containing protein n=1 Tax=Fulvitalea axinellae TaxID=1182444 RepID=A0AAU9D7H8_9BACT|nr:hypothetical protein FUAX_43950 [Fulvitalea axinellae]